MRKRRLILSGLSCSVAVLLTLILQLSMAQQTTSDATRNPWAEVEQLMAQGLPQSAIEKLDPIIAESIQSKNFPTAIRAICTKALLIGNIEGNLAEEKIKRLEAEIATAPDEMKPIMQAILANWYWQFYQQNQWQFIQRTTADASSNSGDLLTWSLPQILQKIDEEFDKAFARSEQLKLSKTTDFETLIDKSSVGNQLSEASKYRPTMFDVIAHNALTYYSSEVRSGVQTLDAFQVKADSPLFSAREDFLAWKPDAKNPNSMVLRAIELYQELLRFHETDEDKTALLDTDLLRLEFAFHRETDNKELKKARYKATLEQFEDVYKTSAESSRASYLLAQLAFSDHQYSEAHKIATRGLARSPASYGGTLCDNLIKEIEARSCEVSCDRVWNDAKQQIRLTYRNIERFHFRLIPFSFEEFATSNRHNPVQLDQRQLEEYLRKLPTKAWSTTLEPTEDFLTKDVDIDVPSGLPQGSYLLFGSYRGDFQMSNDDEMTVREVWVSKLGIVVRNDYEEARNEGFVVDAQSGTPLANATVTQYARNENQKVTKSSVKTDKNGFFQFAPFKGQNYNMSYLLASYQGDTLSSENAYSRYRYQETPRETVHTIFFTDRTLYRPGQTIHYKGISSQVNTEKDSYKSFAKRRNAVVIFRDVNGQEIERKTHIANDYGSFSGTFTAPRDRLTGVMSISMEDPSEGNTSIHVEEYKRPKFEVKLNAPASEIKLGDNVTMEGKATAYTGVAIDNAKVTYRVMREVNFPIWYYWRFWWDQGRESTSIANGTTTTSSDGTFEIVFPAQPDVTVDKASEPKFRYVVYADVTDATGETRSAQFDLTLGYTSLAATMQANEWQTTDTAVSIKVQTTSLNGEGRSAKGVVKIYTLKQPEKVIRDRGERYIPYQPFARPAEEKKDEITSDPSSWPLDRLVAEADFQTDAQGNGEVKAQLTGGIYRAMLETSDQAGNKISAILPLTVLDLGSNKLRIKLSKLLKIEKTSLQPGSELRAVLGSGYENARLFVMIKHRGQVLQSYWTQPGQTQHLIKLPIDEKLRGGFLLSTFLVHENRIYHDSHSIDVPWTNKELTIRWERFISKLEPAQKETWTAIISGPDAEKAAAEMVATLYDESLDAIQLFSWLDRFNFFRRDTSQFALTYESNFAQSRKISSININRRTAVLDYPRFRQELIGFFMHYGRAPGAFGGRGDARRFRSLGKEVEGFALDAAPAVMSAAAPEAAGLSEMEMVSASSMSGKDKASTESGAASNVDLSVVSARKNLQETAFFFPHLVTAADGSVKLEFTMPEALTRWKFMAFAHDASLRSGALTDSIVTAKDLMVQPNAPRFVREGDEIEFTVKVSNKSATHQTGMVKLSFSDARTNDNIDPQLENVQNERPFEIAAGETQTIAWRIKVPDGLEFLTYKAVGSTGRLSDGEEGYLPVISRRILVTESISLPIRGAQTKQFEFKKLRESEGSETLKHQSLTVQMVSNPSWYAVMALPYLMEFPHECSEQVFSRYYANALAQHIANSDPKIKRVFEQWRATPALDSPLTKNEELKAVTLEESPWVRQAQDESQARRAVGVLFEENTLRSELDRALSKLQQTQQSDGMWPWFPGGPTNEFITLYITTGFGRLKHLGVPVDTTMAIRSLSALDAKFAERYADIKPELRDQNHLSYNVALYLYGRSFFLEEQAVAPEHQESINYWIAQAKNHWLKLNSRLSEGQVSLALKRFGENDAAMAITKSLKERSVTNEEFGRFWRDTEAATWWWYRAPIESQAMMIEVFDEVAHDQEAVEDCKVWLLKQKQTQDWRTTKATADAVYSLLLRGSNLLASDELVEVTLGDMKIVPAKVEAGTGFYEERLSKSEVQAAQAAIKVSKVDEGVAWGSVHWQYLEDIAKITPHDQNPLKLTKELYVKTHDASGPKLTKVTGPVHVGDELVVRLVLRTDRDMEYVHMKDHRGSGTEPVQVLSAYHFQDGLGYYQAMKDTASHFYIDYLPKGTYVFEYATRVQLRGNYQTGMANIQCMYAPEFNSHSESLPLTVE